VLGDRRNVKRTQAPRQGGASVRCGEEQLGADENLYASSGKAVSGSRPYESTFSLADYPQVSSDIAPGAFTTGVVVFSAMNEKASLRLIFEGYSDDSDG
jgi:hypothetical protein